MSKPLILIANDDGITAPGIRVLVEVMQTIGEVVVVAPDKPQSAMGHAITVSQPLRLKRSHILMEYWPMSAQVHLPTVLNSP